MENVTPSDTSRSEIRYIFTTPNKRQKGAKANLLQLRTPRSEIRYYFYTRGQKRKKAKSHMRPPDLRLDIISPPPPPRTKDKNAKTQIYSN